MKKYLLLMTLVSLSQSSCRLPILFTHAYRESIKIHSSSVQSEDNNVTEETESASGGRKPQGGSDRVITRYKSTVSRSDMIRELTAVCKRKSKGGVPIVVEDSKYLPISAELAHSFIRRADRNRHKDVQDCDDVARQAWNAAKVEARDGGIQLGFGIVSGRLKTGGRHCLNVFLDPVQGPRLIDNDGALCPWEDFASIDYVLVL